MALLSVIAGIVGNVIACMMFASALPTFWRIFKNKSTEDFRALPYVATMLSVSLWVFYGCVIPNGTLVITINVIGVAFETLYLSLYMIYAPKTKKKFGLTAVQGGLIGVFAFMGVVVAISLLALHGHTRKMFVGTLCAVISICMYASPLGIMKLVVRTKSVEYMPFTLSLFLFINGAAWTTYAIFTSDIYILIPNTIGTFLGVLQLLIYAYYTIRGAPVSLPPGKSVDLEKGHEVGKQNVHPLSVENGVKRVTEKEDRSAAHQSNGTADNAKH